MNEQRAIAKFERLTRRMTEIDTRYEEIRECFERNEVPTKQLINEMDMLQQEDMDVDQAINDIVWAHANPDSTYSALELMYLEWEAYRRTRRRLKDANGGFMPKTLHGFEWWKIPLFVTIPFRDYDPISD